MANEAHVFRQEFINNLFSQLGKEIELERQKEILKRQQQSARAFYRQSPEHAPDNRCLYWMGNGPVKRGILHVN